MNQRLIIYDVSDIDQEKFFSKDNNDIFFSASPIVKQCVGCFGCWVKTPGKCVIKDRCDVIPFYISKSEEVIIISPILYGGYSQNIKAVLDRSIGYILPYFRIINGEMHHQMRYKNPFRLSVHFYGVCEESERNIARQLVKANAVNLGAGSHFVYFHEDVHSIEEELK